MMARMLAAVVSRGTGRAAAVPGVTVLGTKTYHTTGYQVGAQYVDARPLSQLEAEFRLAPVRLRELERPADRRDFVARQ